jgi:hypothetical protein
MPGRVLTAGRRTQLVTFQSPSDGALDATGRPAKTWTTQGTGYVRMRFLGGTETDVGGITKYLPTYSIEMLKVDMSTIAVKWRLLRGSEVYHVISRDESDLDNAELVLVVARDESSGVT